MRGKSEYLHSHNPNSQHYSSSSQDFQKKLHKLYGTPKQPKQPSVYDQLAANLTHGRPSTALPPEERKMYEEKLDEEVLEEISDQLDSFSSDEITYGVPQTGPRTGRRKPDAQPQRQEGSETNMNRRILGA